MLFALGIVILVVLNMTSVVIDRLENTTMSSNPKVNESMQSGKTLPRTYSDFIFVGIFIAMVLSLLILGYFISGYPIFMFIYLLGLVVLGVVGGILTYVWDSIAQSSNYLPYLSYIPITNYLLRHLVLVITVVGFVSMIVMYIGNTRRDGG